MALQDTMGYASTAVTAGYVEQANEAQAPRPVSVRQEAMKIILDSVSNVLIEAYLKQVSEMTTDPTLLDRAREIAQSLRDFNALVVKFPARDEYERLKVGLMQKIETLTA